MDQPFKIKFDFPVANSDITLSLTATAQLHHSIPYYIVQDFYFEDPAPEKVHPSVLPTQELKLIQRGNTKVWVHCDSERETLLSEKIGKAIESVTDVESS